MYGVLEDQFKSGMTEKEALKVAAKAIARQRTARRGQWQRHGFGSHHPKNRFPTIGRKNRTRRIAQAVLIFPAHAPSSPIFDGSPDECVPGRKEV